jgi:hypothetical protein
MSKYYQGTIEKPSQNVINVVVNALHQARINREKQIPKVALQNRHVQNCKLLLNRDELLRAMPKEAVVAEIGVDEGNFSKLINRICRPSKFHLIDIWGTDRFHDGKFEGVKTYFTDEINRGVVAITKKISIEAAQDFEDQYFDWIYIDTDHMYETTRDELRFYAPKIKPGGIIAGHDYVKGNWISSLRYGVIEAVHEFCVKYDWELLYLTAEPIENNSFAIRKI